jgi:hypothetical protein
MLDKAAQVRRIGAVGPEDRALLRSNPSAAADAGIGARERRRAVSAPRPLRGHPGGKAKNLGVWGRAPVVQRRTKSPSGVPFGNIVRAGQFLHQCNKTSIRGESSGT